MPPIVEAKNLTKTYKGKVEVPALNGVDLRVDPNQLLLDLSLFLRFSRSSLFGWFLLLTFAVWRSGICLSSFTAFIQYFAPLIKHKIDSLQKNWKLSNVNHGSSVE